MQVKQNQVALEQENKDDTVTVYVWSTGIIGSLGHVSMKFNDEPNHYWSIWPKSTPAGGLASMWPLQATLSPSLEADCMQEAIRPSADFSNLMGPDRIIPVEPDQVFVVHGVDKDKMKKEFDRIYNGMGTGEVCYQLLPGVNAEGLFNHVLSNPHPNKEVYNCVTLTSHLLKSGGKTNLTTTPWSTPSTFAKQISQLEQVTISETPVLDPENQNNPVVEPPAPVAAPSMWQRFFSFWSSTNTSSADSTHYEASETFSESNTNENAVEEYAPSPRASENSHSFFENLKGNTEARLGQREEESDLNYNQRMDAMVN